MCGSAAAAPAPVVDQAYTAPGSVTSSINDCCAFVAQTFTAGRNGLLAGVNIDTRNPVFTVPSLRVSIRNVEGSAPERRFWRRRSRRPRSTRSRSSSRSLKPSRSGRASCTQS
jgi:hypothetical protein